MEIESGSAIPLLDILVIRKGITLATKVYRKPTLTGQYFNLKSNHLSHGKRGLLHSLHNRASITCQEQGLFNKISSLRYDLQVNGYPQGFIDSVIDYTGGSCPNKEERLPGSIYIPYVKGGSEKFKCTGNRYNIRINFKTKHTHS
jgi:hypothetical protein